MCECQKPVVSARHQHEIRTSSRRSASYRLSTPGKLAAARLNQQNRILKMSEKKAGFCDLLKKLPSCSPAWTRADQAVRANYAVV